MSEKEENREKTKKMSEIEGRKEKNNTRVLRPTEYANNTKVIKIVNKTQQKKKSYERWTKKKNREKK